MPATEFIKPRLIGDRFDGHAIPLEILKDISVLQDMVIELAKWKWRQNNQDRKRSPRGFTDGVILQLDSIEDGSAILGISLVLAANTLFENEYKPYYDSARDAIVSAISEAGQPSPAVNQMPQSALSYFDRFGRSLKIGESIDFGSDTQQRPAILTRQTRRVLLQASNAISYSEEMQLRGFIPEADLGKNTFEFELLSGKRVQAPIEPMHSDTIVDAFTQYKTFKPRVLIDCVAEYGRNHKIVQIETVESVSILDPLDISSRIEEISYLKNGWCNGEGTRYSCEHLHWLTTSLEQNYPDEMILPHIYPAVNGCISVEWDIGCIEWAAEVDINNQSCTLSIFNVETEEYAEQNINLDSDEAWAQMLTNISQGILDG